MKPRYVSVGQLAQREAAGPLIPGPALPALMTGADRFEFLGEEGSLEHGWNDLGKSALWTYNLHYFDDLRKAGAADRTDWHRALIARWIAENPPAMGVGWSPYPTSLRIVNWVTWDLATGHLDIEARRSLADQAEWLARNLETHILGNHLFANLKAQIFAGCYFAGPTADRWLGNALAIFERELGEQVLDDGANFELSPMYHAIFLADLLDILALDRVFPGRIPRSAGEMIIDAAERMLGWMATMTHPDGQIAFFNDSAIGIAADFASLKEYARRVGIRPSGPRVYDGSSSSGYFRLTRGPAVVIADIAAVGPDYQPGHAHADTLSFELSVGKQRVIVNSGTSVYGTCQERHRQRSTAAHSTLELDGKNSSDVWSGFRVGRRARATLHSLFAGGAVGSHDGYRFLKGRPRHERSWALGANELVVTDTVRGDHGCAWDAIVRFHLHPDCSSERIDDCTIRIALPCGSSIIGHSNHPMAITPGTWHPRFGSSIANLRIEIAWRADGSDPRCETTFKWNPDG